MLGVRCGAMCSSTAPLWLLLYADGQVYGVCCGVVLFSKPMGHFALEVSSDSATALVLHSSEFRTSGKQQKGLLSGGRLRWHSDLSFFFSETSSFLGCFPSKIVERVRLEFKQHPPQNKSVLLCQVLASLATMFGCTF